MSYVVVSDALFEKGGRKAVKVSESGRSWHTVYEGTLKKAETIARAYVKVSYKLTSPDKMWKF